MFSVEVYDLLLSTVPCLSRRLSEVDSDTPQKKKRKKGKLISWQWEKGVNWLIKVGLSAFIKHVYVGVKMAFSLNHN